MVSSRWVFGSSKGMRLFSTSRTMKSAAITRTSEAAEHEQSEEERRLGQAGKSGLARAAHSLEGGTRIECGSDREETAEGEQVGKQDRVTLEGQGCVPGDGQQQAGQH